MSNNNETSRALTKEQLDEIVRRLVEAISPQRIILFGSHAYGTSGPDSDIDVYIVTADDAPDRFELSRKGYAALRDIPLPIELHFCRQRTFDRYATVVGSFQREVKQRGRVVYAA